YQPQPPPQLRAQDSAPQEPEERHEIGDADKPPEQPVAPFPPEDRLELIETHAGVELTILRNGFVGFESLAPLCPTERRQGAGDGFPFDDRKPRFGQARGPPDQ